MDHEGQLPCPAELFSPALSNTVLGDYTHTDPRSQLPRAGTRRWTWAEAAGWGLSYPNRGVQRGAAEEPHGEGPSPLLTITSGLFAKGPAISTPVVAAGANEA